MTNSVILNQMGGWGLHSMSLVLVMGEDTQNTEKVTSSRQGIGYPENI